jgi:nucleoside phosphorylase
LENYEADKIINIWIAWSLEWKNANIWDVFIVNKIFQHDMYLPFEWSHLDYAKAVIEVDNWLELDAKYDFWLHNNAFCLTWDKFIDEAKKVEELKQMHDAQVVEMEAFAVASTAREYWLKDKCIFIKAISDWADSEAKDAHMDNLDFAMQNSLKVLSEII